VFRQDAIRSPDFCLGNANIDQIRNAVIVLEFHQLSFKQKKSVLRYENHEVNIILIGFL